VGAVLLVRKLAQSVKKRAATKSKEEEGEDGNIRSKPNALIICVSKQCEQAVAKV
jgi:hypothetical protein